MVPKSAIEHFPVLIFEEQVPVPELARPLGLRLHLLEQFAASLLNLQERQHHQERKDGRQVFLAVTEVVPEAVILVLQGKFHSRSSSVPVRRASTPSDSSHRSAGL